MREVDSRKQQRNSDHVAQSANNINNSTSSIKITVKLQGRNYFDSPEAGKLFEQKNDSNVLECIHSRIILLKM